MKTSLLIAIFALASIPKISFAEKSSELARYQVKLVKHEIAIENKSSTAFQSPNFISEAFAGSDLACLVAGWEGTKSSPNATCVRQELKDPALVAIKCNGNGTVFCNPEVFGDGVCITPAAGDQHFTKSCEDQMLSNLSIQNHDINSISDQDFSKINDSLVHKNWNYLEATDALSAFCGKSKNQHQDTSEDCTQIHTDFLALEQKSLTVLANLPKPVINPPPPAKVSTIPLPSAPKFTGRNADQCGYVNLADKTGPVKDQGVIGDCYSFTAVELMNYGAPANQQISTISTAVQYGEYFEKAHPGKKITAFPASGPQVDGLNGGWTAEAILSTRSEGACLNKDVESYGFGDSIALLEMQQQFELLENPQCDSVQTAAFKSINDFAETVFQNLTKKYKKKTTQDFKFAEKNSHFIAAVMSDKTIAPADRFQAYMRMIVDADCKKEQTSLPSWAVGTPVDEVMPPSDPTQPAAFLKNAFNYINDSLDQGYPTGVDYNPHGLVMPPAKPDGHASLVVGRKYVQGQTPGTSGCFLYVKNSWGTHFPATDQLKGLAAQPAVDGDGKPMPGYYMVKDDVFSNYLYGFANLGNDPKVPLVQPLPVAKP